MKLCETCACLRRPVKRNCTFGYTPVLGHRSCRRRCARFNRQCLKFTCKLHDWTSEKIVTSLRDGRLQLAFIVRPAKRGAFRDLRFRRITP